jgi:small subunit ribosomal protein S17
MATKTKPTTKKVAKPVAKPSAKTTKPVETKKIVVKTVAKTEATCNDQNCIVHGNNKARGRVFEGKVVRAKMTRTITVEWPRKQFLSKYERFEKRRSKVMAHNAPCINAKEGDTVRIAECHPISKSKNFVVLEVLK